MSVAPLFSILQPARDRADLAADCVRSALKQDLGDGKILVLDQSDDPATAMETRS